uniref:Rho guanine nucleotide exchange factor (GEF) 40 n=1 Tax=Mola mola TaxID=94237 RepID=A0A3Q4AE02_MOLML
MHCSVKSNFCVLIDSESLDNCIQSTLSGLYRPFSVTAATVLWQLFSVVERQYRGDGLRCLIDFLLPTKRILQIIQQETCVRFRGLLFYHEGWPLCIHEKVVLQLAPLHKVRLKQGDFYLQIVPLGRKAAKLVIKCLSASGQAITEIPIAESMYGSVFTAEFLQNVTRDRNLHPLQSCLLTTGTAVYRTPWKNVVNPLLVSSTSDAIMQAHCSRGAFRGHLSTCSTSGSTGTLDSHRSSRESLHSQGADSIFSESAEECLTGDGTDDIGGRDRGSKMLSFSTDLSNPGLRRRLPRDSVAFESRRLFRKSYMEALQNPMSLGSSSESILEESAEELLSRRLGGRGWLSGDDSRPSTPLLYLQRGLRSAERRAERRSKSLERNNKGGQVKGHRERSSSGGSVSISPKKLMNGYALRFGKLDVEATFHGSERRANKEESGPCSLGLTLTWYGCAALSLKLLISKMKLDESVSVDPLLASPLPGNRDRSGRAVLQVCTRAQVWAYESCTVSDLTCLLGYYYSTLRKERRDQGLSVVIDSRRQQPVPALLSSLSELQALVPNALYSVLFLVDKEAAAKPERDMNTETLSSLKALLKHIDQTQLTQDLEGTFQYDHNHWIHFRQKMEPFASSCNAAISSLRQSISTLRNSGSLKTSEEVSEVMEQQRHLMKRVLDDSRLNRLRLEGGTILARIRKEEACENENYRDAVDVLNALYNQVDEEVHKLVILSNKSQKDLESLLEVRNLEQFLEESVQS